MRDNPFITILRDVIIPGGRIADITLTNGIVNHVGSSDRGDNTIFCQGKTVLPAGTDIHVHMRDGVQKDKETWKSGTKSAIAGGVTTVVDQPNTIPPIINPEILKDRIKTADKQSYCRFAINGAVTPSSDLEGLGKAGVLAFGETFVGPSSYGDAIDNEFLSEAMDRLSELNVLMTIHAENVIEGDDNSLMTHDILRNQEEESRAILSILNQNQGKCKLHFCHLSSSTAIQKVPQNVATIEVTPHHLFLSFEKFQSDDTHGKVNPPLRSEKTRKELFSFWNQIDVIASDHAPHSVLDKKQSFEKSPSGIPGVETMIPLLMGWVHEKKITITDVINKTSRKPSLIMNISPAGFTPGDRADYAIYPDIMTKIDPENLHSAAGWSPYEGMNAIFPEKVILGGMVVFDNGDFFKPEVNKLPNSIHNTTIYEHEYSSLWIPGRNYIPKDTTCI